MPHRTKMAPRMRAPSEPSENRLAIAQLPAKAAPNTSALIRIAALTTVSTLSQRMRRGREIADWSMGRQLLRKRWPDQAGSGRVARGLLRQQPGLDQGGADAVDLGAV